MKRFSDFLTFELANKEEEWEKLNEITKGVFEWHDFQKSPVFLLFDTILLAQYKETLDQNQSEEYAKGIKYVSAIYLIAKEVGMNENSSLISVIQGLEDFDKGISIEKLANS